MIISIVIPTRNGGDFLESTIKTCLACDDQDIELIISNNNSSDDTEEMVSKIDDPRIVYYHTGEDLSMRGNYEFALSKVTGDYVIFIGDDDGILKNGLKTLRHIIKKYNNPDVVNWRHISYYWPDSTSGGDKGILKFSENNFFGELKIKDPQQTLAGLAHASITNYKEGGNLYHGCVSMKVIERVKEKTGMYFCGNVPDVYSGFANLAKANSIIWVRNPITIGGESKKSSGAAVLSNKKLTADQKKIANSFNDLAKSDKVKPDMDYKLRALLAINYAELNRMNSQVLDGKLNIDHQAWREKIYAEIERLSLEYKKESFILAEELFVRMDKAYQPKNHDNLQVGAETSTTVNTKSKKQKKVINPQHTVSVMAVAQWIDMVTGQPHKNMFENVLLARIFWVFKLFGMRARKASTY